jgi:hypothetical protein
VNPLQSKKMLLPLDCSDLEWSEVPANIVAGPKPKRSFSDFTKSVEPVELLPPAPVQFKSLCESLNELVAAIRGRKRTSHPLAVMSSK